MQKEKQLKVKLLEPTLSLTATANMMLEARDISVDVEMTNAGWSLLAVEVHFMENLLLDDLLSGYQHNSLIVVNN